MPQSDTGGQVYVSFTAMSVTLPSGETIPIREVYTEDGELLSQDSLRVYEGLVRLVAGPMASGEIYDMYLRYEGAPS